MPVAPLAVAVLAAAEENALPVPSVLFPLLAIAAFIVLGAITWSYRDVARRHATKSSGSTPQQPGH